MAQQLAWQADPELAALIRRYYSGEAGLWGAITQAVDAELRRRGIDAGHYHLRLRRRDDEGYDVIMTAAPGYGVEE